MNTKYFQDINTLQELKKEYYRLAKINHPDIGGDVKTMQDINNEYDKLFDYLKNKIDYKNYDVKNPPKNYTYASETNDIFKDIINKIINLDNITIEICGYWVWVDGETKPIKEILKETGFKFSPKKFNWYWRPSEHKSFKRNSKILDMDTIRDMFGSINIEKDKNKNNNNLRPQLT
jgi:curved DNA-binding protein CbpA